MIPAAQQLFDCADRSEVDHIHEPISRFEGVNRSPDRSMQNVRHMLETWYRRYPDPHGDLRNRFRSDDANHDGALFELFLHELFLQLGLSIQIAPQLPSGKSPDFLVSSATRASFVEATYLKQPITTPPLEKPLLNAVEALGAQAPAGIGLIVEIRGRLTSGPPLGPIKRDVLAWLNALNPELIDWGKQVELRLPIGEGAGSSLLVLQAVPKSNPNPPFIVGSMHSTNRNPVNELRKAVKKKCRKYKRLARPLVVAVNMPSGDSVDVETSALFGREGLKMRHQFPNGALASVGLGRTGQGLWFNNVSAKVRNSGLGALWVFRDLAPWSIANVSACLYLNPYVSDQIPDELRSLGYASGIDGVLNCVVGSQTARSILGLPENWPSTSMSPSLRL